MNRAYALVTVTCSGTYLLMTEHPDGWAVPGTPVEPGESPLGAALRGLEQETGLDPMTMTGVIIVVREPLHEHESCLWPVDVDLVLAASLPGVTGGEWVPADTFAVLADALERDYGGRVSAAHTTMISDFLAFPGEVAR